MIQLEWRSWGLDFPKTREKTRGFATCTAKVTGRDDGSRKSIQGVLLSLLFLPRRDAWLERKGNLHHRQMGSFLIHMMGRKGTLVAFHGRGVLLLSLYL
jgi:hypothetical protein